MAGADGPHRGDRDGEFIYGGGHAAEGAGGNHFGRGHASAERRTRWEEEEEEADAVIAMPT